MPTSLGQCVEHTARWPQVIFFDPMYDSYVGMAKAAGAAIKTVPLLPPNFSVPKEQLEAAFSEKTKLILVNTPHNPTGGHYMGPEIAGLATTCTRARWQAWPLHVPAPGGRPGHYMYPCQVAGLATTCTRASSSASRCAA